MYKIKKRIKNITIFAKQKLLNMNKTYREINLQYAVHPSLPIWGDLEGLYAPFGEIMTEYNPGWQSGVIPKYSFNAKELDEENGMYYYSARYYDPKGTFISRDPMFEKYFWSSPYAYCLNNPVKYIDPDGRKVIPTNVLLSNTSVSGFLQKAEANSVFRGVMSRFYSNQSNVYIHLAQLTRNGSPTGKGNVARTESYLAQSNPVGKYGQGRIIINSDILNSSGELVGDQTFLFMCLLHEGLHAKMYDTYKKDNFNNFPGYMDFVVSRSKDGGHHNQMGAFNRQTLIDGMKEFDDQMGTTHSNDWYEAMSWFGLHDSKAWRSFEKRNPETAKAYRQMWSEEVRKLGGE